VSKVLKGCAFGCAGVVVLGVVAVIGGLLWLRSAFTSPKPPDPAVPGGAALRPTFVLKGGERHSAGTAVAVRLRPGGQPILLTALHLFGPDGGLARNIPPAELSRVVHTVFLTPIGERGPSGVARGALRKTGPALPEDGMDVANDVAAFRIPPKSRITALDLAAGNPGFGEWVWLVGDVVDHVPQSQRLFPARVLAVSDEGARLVFETAFPMQAFSGAPVVNRNGQVAGLLIGGGEGGAGIINPAGSIRRVLAESGVR
jgi:hypothetical protein